MTTAPVVARPWGVPIRVHWTFLVLTVLPLLPVWPEGAPGAGTRLLLVMLLACSVAVHEAAHVAVAARLGNRAIEVVLYPFGGVTRFDEPLMPGATEARIAAAGPLASLCLGGVMYLMGNVMSGSRILEAGALGNAALAAGNLIPAWPLDGGRVARSLLSPRFGAERATRWTGFLGQLFGLMVILAGLRGHLLWLIPGAILFFGASSELHRLSLESFAARLTVGDAMLPQPILASSSSSVEDLRETSSGRPGREILLVHDGRPVAYLPAARLWSAPADFKPLADLAETLGPELESATPVVEAIQALETAGARAAPVEENGRIVGVVTLDGLHRAVDLAGRLAGLARTGTGPINQAGTGRRRGGGA